MFNKFCFSLLVLFVALSLVSCSKDKQAREWQYMPDMYVSPAEKPQENNPDVEGQSYMLTPPAGTVPRNFVPYQIAITDTIGANNLVNPLPVTEEVLAEGQKYFDIFCKVCHGPTGAGDGPIIPKMTKPPLLYSEKVINWPDGRIYHTITYGQGNMPSYRNAVDPMTRWAIIHYLRALQKSQAPDLVDLKAENK